MNEINKQADMQRQYYDDEISLIDLVKILFNRKWLIVAVFILVQIAVAFYLSQWTPVYESRATVLLGDYGSSEQFIETASSVKQRLESEYRINEPDYDDLEKYPYPKVITIGVTRNIENFVSFIVQSDKPDTATSYLETELSKFMNRHSKIFDSVISTQSNLLNQQQLIVDQISEDVNNFNDLIEDIKVSEPTQAVLLKVEQLKFNERLPEITSLIGELEFKIANAKKTRVVKSATFDEDPVNNKTKLIVLIGLVVGVFAGIFAAFMFEFFVNVKKELEKDS